MRVLRTKALWMVLVWFLGALAAFAQSPSNTYNWDVVLSGSAVVPSNATQTVYMTDNLAVVIHNNGTNAFTPASITMDGGSFSGSNYFGLNGVASSTMSVGSIAAAATGTATLSPKLALRSTGTGAKSIQSSVHAITVDGCDDVVFVSFNASGGWTVTGTGTLNVTNATWSPTGPTVHVYREGPGTGGREGAAGDSSGALNLHIDIGRAGPQEGKMSLELRSNTLTVDTAKAAGFSYIGMASSPVELINAGEGRRQFVSPSGLANLQDIKDGSNNYLYTELSLYHDAGAKSGSYYPGSGSPYKTIRFAYAYDSGDHIDSLTVTETEESHTEDTVYQFDEDTEEWSLVTAEENRKEKLTEVVNSGTRTVTTEVRDGANTLLSKVREIYTPFAWGEELTQRINDPDTKALTMTWSYGTTAGANDYKRLIKTKDERGHWERYEYDSQGRVTKTVIQHLDAADAATDAQSLVRTTTYDGDNETHVETLLGQETGRRHLVWSGTGASQTQRVEQCVTAGASAGASDNLVTSTTYLSNGQLVVQPDGTLSKTTTEVLSGGGLRTTTEIGQTTSGTSVIAGRKRIVEQDSRGNVTSDLTRDIGTDLVIAQATTTDTDDFGRATEIDYLDGTTEAFQYGCCGLEQKTDRTGLITSYQHDAFGNVELETTAGISINSQYDALGRLNRRYRIGTDSSSILLAGTDYNLAGQPTALLTASGTTSVSQTLDSTGIETRTETLAGGGTRIEKTYPDGNPQEIGGTAAFPRTYEYGVDSSNGRFTKETLVGIGGATTEWTKTFYDLTGRAWKTLYPDNAAETSYWNTKGQLTRQVDPDGVTRLYGYNDLGELEDTALDANGNNTIDYSGSDRIARNRLTYLTANSETVARRTTSAWKESGEITTSESDTSLTSTESWQRSFGVENHTTTAFSGSGAFTVTATSNTGRTVTETYTIGRLTSRAVTGSGSESAGAQSFAYDPHGRIEDETADGLDTVSYTYYNTDLTHTVTQDGNTVEFEYDAQGNRTKIIRAGSVETESEYYPTGRLKKTFGGLAYPVDYAYDPQGRMKTLTTYGTAGNAVTTWNYHAQRGWPENKRYANNKGPDYTYTPAGRLLTRAWARNGTSGGRLTATRAYTALGDLNTVTYSDGSTGLDYDYDRLGRVDDIAQGSATYDYTWADDGQLTGDEITSGPLDGVGTDFAYDNRRRLEQITVNSGTASMAMPYTFDGASRLKTAGQGNFLATYVYVNGSSRIDKTEFRYSGTLKGQTERGYDDRGRFESITTLKTADSSVISSHSYITNDLDQRTRATLQDGSKWDYGYDDLGQVTSAGRTWSDTSAVAGQQYAYVFDTIGNRTSTTTNGRTAEYTPNILNQYEDREVPGTIDVIGSATSTATVTVNGGTTERHGNYFYKALSINNASAAQYPELNISAVLANSGTAGGDLMGRKMGNVFLPKTPEEFAYDDDGNMISDGRFSYSWDAENRLIGLESLSGAPADSKRKATYSYDPLGRRVQKKVWLWDTIGSAYALEEDIRFAWAGWNIVGEIDASGAVLRHNLWGLDLSGSLQGAGGVGGLLCTTTVSGGLAGQRLPAHDGNGNVMMMINAATAETEARFEYDAFGQEIRSSGPAVDEARFRFSTKFPDWESDLLMYQLRPYRPSIGTWLSLDPIEEQGGMNLYGILQNGIVNWVDYLGLSTLTIYVNRYWASSSEIRSTVKISSDDSKVNSCCGLPQSFHGIERGPNETENLLTPGTKNSSFTPENSPEYGENNPSGAGLTSIKGRVDKHGEKWAIVMPSSPSNMPPNVYGAITGNEFRIGQGGDNIHAGPNKNHSSGCVLLGHCIDPSGGYDSYQGSIGADFDFKAAVQCAKNTNPGIKLRTIVSSMPVISDPKNNPFIPKALPLQ